jgi:hypothetical protein
MAPADSGRPPRGGMGRLRRTKRVRTGDQLSDNRLELRWTIGDYQALCELQLAMEPSVTEMAKVRHTE